MIAAAFIIKTIFFVGGIIAFFASILNWKWFLQSKNAEFLTKKLGYRISRIIYAILGIVLMIFAFSIK